MKVHLLGFPIVVSNLLLKVYSFSTEVLCHLCLTDHMCVDVFGSSLYRQCIYVSVTLPIPIWGQETSQRLAVPPLPSFQAQLPSSPSSSFHLSSTRAAEGRLSPEAPGDWTRIGAQSSPWSLPVPPQGAQTLPKENTVTRTTAGARGPRPISGLL